MVSMFHTTLVKSLMTLISRISCKKVYRSVQGIIHCQSVQFKKKKLKKIENKIIENEGNNKKHILRIKKL